MARSGSPLVETLVIFAVVFVLQWIAALFSVGLMAGLFVLAPPLEANPWTIVTSVYAHENLGHLLSNSAALVLFGWPVARATTHLRFHAFFLATGAIAGITQVVGTGIVGVATPVLGASGAVFALMGYLLAGNRLSDGLASRVQVSPWVALGVFVVLAALITLATAAPRVALLAHFTGFLLGLVAGRVGVLDVPSHVRRRSV
ncbi:putative membrane protein [Halovivax ruber XH-70]|uniref:Putative membrane protein n=1 Tax=Halovivax ruber (strain DSM 18193 / JCM 13892 / XH-70) TaxID=797302 RepID=L0IE11_HALRX|nr:rhomboid family intramembrane serine protease [Halovivax ruber]AGB16999.1 putative membrane protein [Halovivax ruber XH-70]